MATHTSMAQGNDPDVRCAIEQSVGIIHFVTPKEHGWSGTIRKRYTDFQVHEINKDGEVLRLHDYATNAREYERQEAAKASTAEKEVSKPLVKSPEVTLDNSAAPKASKPQPSDETPAEKKENEVPSGTVSASDVSLLVELLGQDTADGLIDLHNKIRESPKTKPKDHGSVKFPAIFDRALRGRIHSEIRRIFSGKIDTATDSEGIIQAKAAGNSNQKWGNRSNNQSRNNQRNGGRKETGKYLHFTLYKENTDTMEAVGQIARILGFKAGFFGIAGTKDRRAVTVQRVSIRGRDPTKLLFINNNKVRGVKIGDFKFDQNDIYLGCHKGNEFTIVMKDCCFRDTENESFERQMEIAQSTVDSALHLIAQNGFINYFGTQRFGTFEIGTQVIGTKILKGDFEGAVNDLLSYDVTLVSIDTSVPNPGEYVRYEDINRAKVLAKFEETGDAQTAWKTLPRRCNTERALLQHLEKQPKDFVGALMSITRSMRSMYIHAYQSLVWNFVASKRWELFGSKVVKGDLVLGIEESTEAEKMDTDEVDEETIHLTNVDEVRQRAHILTIEEAESGRYSISDVVLPTPGHDVVYPDNEISAFYTEFMGKEENGGLDPYGMHRRQKEFSLSGSYRKLIGSFIGTPSGFVQSYTHDNDQLVPTDLDLIRSRRAKEATEQDAALREKNPGWYGFADNVQDNERKQIHASREAQRRKAEEEHDDAVETRVNDTWVQTSLDGNSKRVRVAKSTVEIDQRKSANDVPAVEDVMDIDEPGADTEHASTEPRTQPEPLEKDAVLNQQGLNVELTPETTKSNTTQASSVKPAADSVRADSPEEDVSLPAATTTCVTEDSQDCSTGTEVRLQVADHADENGSNEQVPQKTDVIADIASQATQDQSSTDPVSPKPKIAVVLKFALHPSEYATMVLRELQG